MRIDHYNSKSNFYASKLLEEGILAEIILICGIAGISNLRVAFTAMNNDIRPLSIVLKWKQFIF